MATYRIYRLDRGGRLVLGETFNTSGDEAAIALARELQRDGVASELWCGGRIVGRFSRLGEFTRGAG